MNYTCYALSTPFSILEGESNIDLGSLYAAVYSGIKPAENVTRLAFSVRQATPCIYLNLPYSLIIKKCLLCLNKISLRLLYR